MNNEMQEPRIRLILLDDLTLFRASLGRFLASDPAFELVGDCGAANEALEALKRSAVDVIVFDFDSRTDQGDDVISAARQSGYQGRFLVLSGAPDVLKSAIALKGGASGIFLKSEAPDRLVHAIKTVANGEMWVDPKVIRLLADQLIDRSIRFDEHRSPDALGDRERTVLLGVVEGLSNRKIADNLGLSESSVKNVLQKLFAMTAVRSRSQLVRRALEGSLGSGVVRLAEEVANNGNSVEGVR